MDFNREINILSTNLNIWFETNLFSLKLKKNKQIKKLIIYTLYPTQTFIQI